MPNLKIALAQSMHQVLETQKIAEAQRALKEEPQEMLYTLRVMASNTENPATVAKLQKLAQTLVKEANLEVSAEYNELLNLGAV